MFFSNLYFPLNKDVSKDNDIISYKLMLKSNLISKVSSGIYIWLPLGLKVVKNIEEIVRKEMLSIGYNEIFMPVLQPDILWRITGRWDKFGDELFKLKDRNDKEFCLGPTHEEIITSMFVNKINSYKDLPYKFFQIQTKFRDEIRPRYGVMRSKEFLMKDAYSFHKDIDCFNKAYSDMYNVYISILNKLCLDFNVVSADSGKIGNSKSHEFHVIADSGEDKIVYSSGKKYFANIELAERFILNLDFLENNNVNEPILVDTPNIKRVDDLSKCLNIEKKYILKTLLVKSIVDSEVVAVLIRGDHEVNFLKLEKTNLIKKPFEFVEENIILSLLNCSSGYIGPLGMNNIKIIADYDVINMKNFVCGANFDNKHYSNVNWNIDFIKSFHFHDIRYVVFGDKSPLGDGDLIFKKGIEVGHIFELGCKYTMDMGVYYYDKFGVKNNILMGCYGIGITRLVAAVIEQFNDKDGITWPVAIAPYKVIIVPVGINMSFRVKDVSLRIYKKILSFNIDCLYYDKEDRLSVIFKNIDLIGISHRIIVNIKTVDEHIFEYKNRFEKKVEYLDETTLFNRLI